jgi:diguanylate cyclase (GGDEF)-like protein
VTPVFSDVDDLVALGAFAGAQVLVVIFSVIKANAYSERAYLLHAAATMMAVLAVQTLAESQPIYPQVVLLLVMGLAGLQLRDLVSHAGALRQPRRWVVATSLALMPITALASVFSAWVLVLGTVVWVGVVAVVLRRAWRQSKPWVWWLVPGLGGLAAAAAALAWEMLVGGSAALAVAGLLTLWAACVYLATGWRGRIFGMTRARVDARNTIDPLTGMAMPMVLTERIHAARNMVQRYGHPSVLLMVHIEHLARLSAEFGPEASEAAVLAAASRVRQVLRDGDVAARLTHSRFVVLAEGLATAEAAGNVASRLLVAGLKEPIPSVPAEFLHFRIVLAPIPVNDVPPKQLLARMGSRMDHALHAPPERRIVTLTSEELLA